MTSLEVKRKADIQKLGFFSIKQMRFCIKVCFLSPSVYLGIGLVWDNLSNPITTTHFLVRLLKSSSNWTKLSMMGPQLLSPSGDLGIGLVWNNLSNPIHPTHFLVWLLESSSNWTKLSMMGPQLFSGWYQMILDVFRCSLLFSDVFSLVVAFMHDHPLCDA